MPMLRDVQEAMRAHVLGGDEAIGSMLAGGALQDRLGIYRNTVVLTLTRALRLAFPAAHKLVGEAFFEAAAGIFIAAHPPRAACLDLYGEHFPLFLELFEPARGLSYLPDVARLEWAVNRALHAPDAAAIDLHAFGAMTEAEVAALRLTAQPAVTFLKLDHSADAIWRAVLDDDDASLAAIDVSEGPVHLLVERGPFGIAVQRLRANAWQFGFRLAEGNSLGEVISAMPDFDAISALAIDLAAGRFTSFIPAAKQSTDEERGTHD